MEKTRKMEMIIIPLLLLIAVGYYIYRDIEKEPSSANEQTSNSGIDATGDYTVEQVPIDPGETSQAPSLDKKVMFDSSITPEVKKILSEKILELVNKLKTDSTSLENWINLGAQFKGAGDYERAKEVWEYATQLNPTYHVPFNNLGDLYTNYIKDYQKAEQNLKKAITLNQSYVNSYRSLYELYRYSYTEKANLADDILIEGISKNPKSTDLMVLLAQYYKETGDKNNARVYFQKALTEAKAQGNTSLATLIEQELTNL